MISAAWSAECIPTDSSTEDVTGGERGRKSLKQGFRLGLLDGRICSSAVCVLKAEGGHNQIKCSLLFSNVIRRDSQANEQAKEAKASQMKRTRTVIVHMHRSFLSVMKASLNYAKAYELQQGASFAKACIKDTVKNMMLVRYRFKQTRLSPIRYVMFFCK